MKGQGLGFIAPACLSRSRQTQSPFTRSVAAARSREFSEMPCLRLTRGQAQRLFALRADVCERVLAALVNDHTLTCGADDRYRITDLQLWRGRSTPLEPRAFVAPKAS